MSDASPPAPSASTETATLGGGCFWCVEGCFLLVPAVSKVVSGYAGGTDPKPTYEAVCSGRTGHAEVIQVTFDPSEIKFEDLLKVFWQTHDPTTPNQQGHDIGTQYRSAIFYENDAQRAAAERSRTRAQANWPRPIVTEIAPLTKFFPAEAYHQDYVANNGGNPYCQFVSRPKIEKFRRGLRAGATP